MSAREDEELRHSLKSWQAAGVVVFLILVASFPLYKAVESTRRDQALTARQTALVTTGHRLWTQSCASCHGKNGDGVDAPALNSQQFLSGTSDDQIHRIVSAGISGTEMPTWLNELGGSLTDDEIEAIVAYIRSWQPTAPDRPNWRHPGAVPSATP
jgi:mono/diheme cytochrome c family protein